MTGDERAALGPWTHYTVEVDISALRESPDPRVLALLRDYDRLRAYIANLESEARSLEYLHGKAVDERNALAAELAKAQAALCTTSHKAAQYDAVVAALQVADGGAYRNDTIESLLARVRENGQLRTELEKAQAALRSLGGGGGKV